MFTLTQNNVEIFLEDSGGVVVECPTLMPVQIQNQRIFHLNPLAITTDMEY